MTTMLLLLLTIPMAPLIIEDFRHRQVHIVWLALFAGSVLGVATAFLGILGALINLAVNICLLTCMACGLLLWIRSNGSRLSKAGRISVQDCVGIGDMVFLVSIAPLFDIRKYLLFLLVSMIWSLVWWAAVRIIRRKNVTIPFVGTGGMIFCFSLIIYAL